MNPLQRFEHRLETVISGVFARAGLRIPPFRQVMAFHTRYMRTILERDPAAAVEAPLKVVVRQDGRRQEQTGRAQ